jgi:hypothetical protein
MEYLLQPTPIPCSNCHTMTRPSQQTINREKEIVVEATWRCPQCGAFLKRGLISRTPKQK